jgi:hypothetical protein
LNRSGCDQRLKAFARRADIEDRRLLASRRTEHQVDGAIETFHFAWNRLQALGDGGIRGHRFTLQQTSQQRGVDPDHVEHALDVVNPVASQKREPPVTGRLLKQAARAGQ